MAYKSLKAALLDLEKTGQLLRIKSEIDPNLEMAEIHRQVYARQGPAILFERVKGSPFMAASNLFGTRDRTAFLFRHTLKSVQKIIDLKLDPFRFFKSPLKYWNAPFAAVSALPMCVPSAFAPVLYGKTRIQDLPQIKSWPMDGGAFITLPQVYSENPDKPGPMQSNLGMYRIQLSGNQYLENEEIGLHYQLHRGIGVHHTQYNQRDDPFRVSIFVGGPPSHAFSAIMPLPEGLPEVTFAGMMGGRRFRHIRQNGFVLSADADFCITGIVQKGIKKPEGPFGDHLGYYSLEHDFPVMKVENVYHRKDAIWHFTVVGRPPQEDSSFGWLIHEIVAPLTPAEFPGLKELHAVDAAGVHPLLLAIGHERYMPFRDRVPEEILTIAHKILGTGQTSLAKFLFIAASDDDPSLDTHDMKRFFEHVLQRVDWRRDLHFQTNTTIDTLDYSGSGWNQGSKLVVACRGEQKRQLATEVPAGLRLPEGFSAPRLCLPGILAVQGPKYGAQKPGALQMEQLASVLDQPGMDTLPLVIVCDDSAFLSATLDNFLWATFTRANPALDVYGVQAFTEHKHWGCAGALIIDARKKPHHAPELETDPALVEKVERLLENYKF